MPEEYYERNLIKALKHGTTVDALIQRELDVEILRRMPYPKATPEEILEIQSAFQKLNDKRSSKRGLPTKSSIASSYSWCI
jgi:hypothetical protein